MEIFYNASHLWTSIHYKLYYARNIIMTGGINYLILNRFPEGRIDLRYVAWNKIQSAAMFNATFFYYLASICWNGYRWWSLLLGKVIISAVFPFLFFFCFFPKSSLNNTIRQIVCDLCQGFAGNTEASSSNYASLRHVWICKAPPFFFFFLSSSFHYKVSTWKCEIVWKPFALQGLHVEKPHRAELCKNVWCSFLSWAYATFCCRESVCVVAFFTELQLWPWGGRAGQGQQLSSPLWALWHAWPGQKHKVSKNIPTMLLSSQILPHVTVCAL